MGWWLLNEKGDVADFKDGRELQNAIPNKDSSINSYMGDVPADIMGEAVEKIIKEYKETWKRPPNMLELVSCFNFVCGPKKLTP